jgi:hypothetical protein
MELLDQPGVYKLFVGFVCYGLWGDGTLLVHSCIPQMASIYDDWVQVQMTNHPRDEKFRIEVWQGFTWAWCVFGFNMWGWVKIGGNV